jgi:anti-sigma-K factor RskA
MTAEQRKEAEKALRETVKSATEETFDASAPESGPANPVMGNINVQAQFTPKTIKSKNGGKPRTMRKSDWTDAIRDEAKAAAKKAVAEVLRSHGIEVAE